MTRRFAPNPARRTELHRQLETRCGLSETAAMLLIELDAFPEVQIEDAHLAAFAELESKGLAEVAPSLHAGWRVRPGTYVREIVERTRMIIALEDELARRKRSRARRRAPARVPVTNEAEPKQPEWAPPTKLTPELERAIIEDALALIDQHPTLPAARDVRVYLLPGRRFVRVYWQYAGARPRSGSLLYYVEIATKRIYNGGGSSKKIPTSRFVGSLHA